MHYRSDDGRVYCLCAKDNRRPISRLADFTQEITESGKFENQRITMKTGDEIEALSDSFNFMMEELENYIANLSKVTAEKERIGTELDIARNIQASMLPCIFRLFRIVRN